MHAVWNILARRQGGSQACIWRMQLFVVAVGAAPALIALVVLECISLKAVMCLLGSGVSCGFYYVSLGRGYESGDFTSVYPAARALPVLLVGIGDVCRGHPPNGLGWAGMALVALGCLLVPLSSFRDLRPSNYLRPVSVWIVMTALGTVGYSLFDKVGTEAIPTGPVQAAVYCYLFFVTTVTSYVPLRRLLGARVNTSQDVGWRIPALAGALCFCAYWLVLWAYQMTSRASYVVAFRQFSILIGVLIAFRVFNESGKAVRLTGALAMTLGLLLVKVCGN
jgi:uncharacterized membrane protein